MHLPAFSNAPDIPSLSLPPCTAADATPWIREALDLCRKQGFRRLILPQGRYEFHADFARESHLFISNNDSGVKRVAFFLDQFEDFEIDGQGSLLIFHGYIVPFYLDRCRRVAIRNLRIDWHHPFHSEVVVSQVHADGIDLEIPQQYPYRIDDGRLVFQLPAEVHATGVPPMRSHAINNIIEFDSRRREPAFKACDHYGLNHAHHASALAPGRVRFQTRWSGPAPVVGNVLAMIDGGRSCPAIAVNRGAGITLEGIAIHYAPGMGIIAQFSEDLTLRQVAVKPGPESGRMVSAQADATHFIGCRGAILIEDCEFSHQLDDATNVHGMFTPVVRRLSEHRAIVRLHHFQQRGMEPYACGDAVELITAPMMAARGANRLSGVEQLNSEHVALEFRDPLPSDFGPGYAVGSLHWVADVTIRRTHVHANRARGYLVTTGGRWIIEDNRFHTAGAAILIEADAHGWHESGAVRDVLIRGNVFENCNYGPWGRATIDIDPGIPKERQDGQRFHRNIRIEGNRFRSFHRDLVKANCVDGLAFTGNHIDVTHDYPGSQQLGDIVVATHCSNVTIADNAIID